MGETDNDGGTRPPASSPLAMTGANVTSTQMGTIIFPEGPLSMGQVHEILGTNTVIEKQALAKDVGIALKTLYNFWNEPEQSGTAALVALALERKNKVPGTALAFFDRLPAKVR